MTDESKRAVVVPDRPDPRKRPSFMAGEREVLDQWLDMYRQTVILKVSGLTAEELARRPLPPCELSLIGVVRHLAEVEAYWLREVIQGENVVMRYSTKDDPDADIEGATEQSAAEDIAAYEREIASARAVTAHWEDLDRPVVGRRQGHQVNLRWILTHLIEEYARHLGHMDLLRESIDGRTGY